MQPCGLYVGQQALLSVEFSRQEYWSGLPFPSRGHLPDPGIEPVSPPLQADSLPAESLGKPVGEPQLWRPNKCSRYVSFYFFGYKWQIHIQTGLSNQEILLVYINENIGKERFRDGLIRILFWYPCCSIGSAIISLAIILIFLNFQKNFCLKYGNMAKNHKVSYVCILKDLHVWNIVIVKLILFLDDYMCLNVWEKF